MTVVPSESEEDDRQKNRDAGTRRAEHLQNDTVCKINFKLLHENLAHGANTSAANS